MHEPQPEPEVTAASRAFLAAVHPPETAPRAALWFAFRGDRLLVRSVAERAELLDYAGGEIRLQADEIAEAAWFHKHGELPRLPGKLSIARRLIDSFLTTQ